MTTSASLNTNQPKLKTGNEIWLLLGVENQLFLRKNVLSCQAKLQNYILFCHYLFLFEYLNILPLSVLPSTRFSFQFLKKAQICDATL